MPKKKVEGVSVVFCPECGKEIPAGSNFCLFCGLSLDRVRRFLEETQITKEKGNPHVIGEMTDENKAKSAEWVVKGDIYVSSGAEEDALKCYTAAIGLDPSSYEAWNRKAELLVRMGRTMEARICNENIIHLKPTTGTSSIPERSTAIPEQSEQGEAYIGGLSSPSLKFSLADAKGKDLAGAIGTNVGGYGIYVTDRRVFILKNQKHVFGHPKGPAIGGFVYAELFGRTIDNMKRTIGDLEVYKEIELEKKDLKQVNMKRPVLLSGYISFLTNDGELIKIFIDHKSVYEPVRHLMLKFCPEKL
ncbi:MAG: zinc-ribbon domain-containing protein, partial [Methanoregulaceae archaeon]|nr:zinc-ribbon domain-containing protein [Methanoregulaceae archaeon]